jgi:uncharacterized protein (TIGR02270 family)
MNETAHRIAFGFSPAEISAITNVTVVREHAGEVGFLWLQRCRAVDAPHYRLKHVHQLDQRINAHLSGLTEAGDNGWRLALEELAAANQGNVFAVAYLAIDSGKRARIDHALSLALAEPQFGNALFGALTWVPPANAQPIRAHLASSPEAQHRYIACTATKRGGVFAKDELTRFLCDDDPSIRACALRGIGELKYADLRSNLMDALRGRNRQCRLWAAWSLTMFGEARLATTVFELGLSEADSTRFCTETAMRFGEHEWARQTIRSLVADSSRRRLALIALGAFGDPASIPWLIEQCADDEHARLAGEAVSTITGADLKYLDLNKDCPEDGEGDGDNTIDEMEDSNLPCPAPDHLRTWWSAQAKHFSHGERYLCGERTSDEAALTLVLRNGYQRQRMAAALELARLNRQVGLFPVRDRSDWQMRRLLT